jgi:uncharacterized protein (TIGR00369 family)
MNYNIDINTDQNVLLAIGEKILSAQPFSKFLGTRIISFQPGKVVLETPIKKEYLQQNGFAHGGLISYAADNALTFAGGSVLGIDVLTLEFKINFLRPATGVSLLAIAEVIYSSKRHAACRCDIFSVAENKDKKLCAAAQGSILLMNAQNDRNETC